MAGQLSTEHTKQASGSDQDLMDIFIEMHGHLVELDKELKTDVHNLNSVDVDYLRSLKTQAMQAYEDTASDILKNKTLYTPEKLVGELREKGSTYACSAFKAWSLYLHSTRSHVADTEQIGSGYEHARRYVDYVADYIQKQAILRDPSENLDFKEALPWWEALYLVAVSENDQTYATEIRKNIKRIRSQLEQDTIQNMISLLRD